MSFDKKSFRNSMAREEAKFHAIPSQRFIEQHLEQMGWEITVKLWKEIPRKGHRDDPPDVKVNLDEFAHTAAVQELMDYKLATHKYAIFEPLLKGRRGQIWRFETDSDEGWSWKKRGQPWKKVAKQGKYDFISDEEKEKLNSVFLERDS